MKYLFLPLMVLIAWTSFAQSDDYSPPKFVFNVAAVGAFPTEDFKDKAEAGDGYGIEFDALFDISKNGSFQIGVGLSWLLQASQQFDQTVNVQNFLLDVTTTVDQQIINPYVKARWMALPYKKFSPFASVAVGARSFLTRSSYSYEDEPSFLETLFGIEDETSTVRNKEHEDWSMSIELAGGVTYNVHPNFDIQLQAFRLFGGETSYINKDAIWQDGPDRFDFETTTSRTNMWGIKLGVSFLLY